MKLDAVFQNCFRLVQFLLRHQDAGFRVKDFVFNRLFCFDENAFLVFIQGGLCRFQCRFRLNFGGLGIGQLDLLLLPFRFKNGLIQPYQEVAAFNQRSFGHNFDNSQLSISGPCITTDLDVLATLNFSLVQNLGDELSLNNESRDRLEFCFSDLGTVVQPVAAVSNQRQGHDDHQHDHAGRASSDFAKNNVTRAVSIFHLESPFSC